MNIKTILSKPIPVVWYRFVQLIKLKFYFRITFWGKIERKINRFTTYRKPWKEKSCLFDKSLSPLNITETLRIKIIENADKIKSGKISIFDVDYHFNLPIAWNKDWRTSKMWKNAYFKSYAFYEKEKEQKYDVKFPWELSRLSFLITVAQAYQINENKDYLGYVHSVLLDWLSKNPLAYSVNWYPMEVSVRTINLIQLREILLESPKTDDSVNLINEILLLHGIFLWRNIEYTDIRGNHYSANLTALLLLGKVYKKFYKEARLWFNYALKNIEKEFHLQFLADGVNFEKSTSYHRLVVEFYLISFIVMKRYGIATNSLTLNKLRNACKFIKDYSKPNKSTPIIGDNDSASVFQNDVVNLNDHSNILQLASHFFSDTTLNISSTTYLSSIWIFNQKSFQETLDKNSDIFRYKYYSKGGFVVVKEKLNYFITDVGEVGMEGRGGHGHNDLFGFELMLDGQDFIVDAGCYTYTGDLALKNEMKSSAYHNILTVDGKEIAPLIGNWGIADIAKPYNLVINENQEKVTVRGKHGGYERLPDPVVHQRTFELDKNTFKLSCIDAVSCHSEHNIQRHLHFSDSVKIVIRENDVLTTVGVTQYVITCDENSKPTISSYYLSYNYGHKTSAQKVTFETKIEGTCKLHFTIEKETGNE
ncbi:MULTISPECIES: alginate lyase family protein [Arenibacter]|uniref:alginate lyase family protein n=1 Tax=Arenibacter TaxID=178469 RepID=UPI0004DF569E|nr:MULTISPECIES: alginate lyase family protein [Arenibacter]GBF18511.1 heparin-sulfate lyase precursor [Arenibacter sp. NBRC 103722]